MFLSFQIKLACIGGIGNSDRANFASVIAVSATAVPPTWPICMMTIRPRSKVFGLQEALLPTANTPSIFFGSIARQETSVHFSGFGNGHPSLTWS